MDVILSILALVMSLLGIIGAIFPLPGILFSYLGLLCAYFCSYSTIPSSALVWWAVASVVISVVDFVLPPFFTKKLGGSKAGVVGSTVGMVAGFFFFPPVGIILCPIFGAILGELCNDKSDTTKAFKVGMASFVSFIAGTGIKLIATVWMMFIFLQELINYAKTLF
ncbi:MAG: DUF456 domain-containing protein [Rikenellaceae bacterium]